MSRLVCNNKKSMIVMLIFFLLFFNVLSFAPIVIAEQRPDLVFNYITMPDEFIEGEDLEFIVNIKNQGDKNVSSGEKLGVALILDGLIVATNITYDGLPAGSTIIVNLSWEPAFENVGFHLLRIEVDYEDLIIESNENNNVQDSNIEVLESETNLEILSIISLSNLVVNQSAKVYSTVKNKGKDSSEPIYAKLNSSEDGEIESLVRKSKLARGDSYVFEFDWTPSRLGSQEISVDIVYKNKTHDYKEKSVMVSFNQLEWWNDSWHYRYFTTVNGSGNVSLSLNFTEFLNELGVFGKTFQNTKIRIIEYNRSGGIIGEIVKYKFNESIDFDPINNAVGTLIWNVTGVAFEKYFCIYFDVTINQGMRTEISETDTINKSGDAEKGYFDLLEGWWSEFIEPINNSHSLVNTPINITILTVAKAEDVVVDIFITEDPGHSFTIYPDDIDDATLWKNESFIFDEEGNWTIRLSCNDWADYNPSIIQYAFFVGKPDLELIDFNYSTNWSYTSPAIYKNDTANITAIITAHNATMENVNVSISIYDLDAEKIIFSSYKIVAIEKDINNLISFYWLANESGDFEVTVSVDPDDEIEEQNESNNEIIEEFTVHEWPDLEVKKIIVPSTEFMEFEEVEIETIIVNNGEGDAKNYEVVLYLEKESDGIMTYKNKIDSILFSLDAGKSDTFSLFWESAEPGIWLVGIQVLRNDTKRDINKNNNQLLSNKTLKIRGFERNLPVIKNVKVTPSSIEQGGKITITANISDDTGLEYVDMIIKDPNNKSYKGAMIRTIDDEFIYTFYDTLEVGTYKFIIEAVDISVHSNKAIHQGSFKINKDETDPVISFFGAIPDVQLKNKKIKITCVATDNVGINRVRVYITSPNRDTTSKTMTWSQDGKYIYQTDYEAIGKYSFYIIVEDKAGNKVTTDTAYFWITENLDDTDNDGMPDEWEEKYGLDPFVPDGDKDEDDDGISNYEEYKAGNNPTKDILGENVAYRIKDNVWYLVGSIVLFILILILSIFAIRRK